MTASAARFLRAAFLAILSLLTVSAVAAYPEHPIHIIVPFSSGSPPDILARLIGDQWKRAGFADVVVINQPGAGGSLAIAKLAKTAPDGYTVAVAGDAALVVNPWLYPTLPLSPLQDLTPISQLIVTPTMLVVGKDVSARTVSELMEDARQRPGTLSFASVGAGTSAWRNGELLQRAAAVKLTHVPYKSSPLPDVVEGRVTMFFANPAALHAFLAGGRLRPLAVASSQRLPGWPSVPTMAEAGFPQASSLAWFALVGPAGMPAEIAERLSDEAGKALRDPAVAATLDALGGSPIVSSPAALRTLIGEELPRWRVFVQEAGLQPR